MVRSGTMRLSYLGQDRVDIQEATKCLAQGVLRFSWQRGRWNWKHGVCADFAGVITRRSTSGLVMVFEKHHTLQYHTGCDREFLRFVKGGAALLGLRSLMEDLGMWVLLCDCALTHRLPDSQADGDLGAEDTSHPVSCCYKVSRRELRTTKVFLREDPLADCLTTSISAGMDGMASQFGLEFRKGRSAKTLC